MIRRAAVAGSWYPGSRLELTRAIEGYLSAADAAVEARREGETPAFDSLVGIVVPHAGLMYSGPVAAHAYRHLRGLDNEVDVVALVGPSHFVAFDGVSVYDGDGFETPLGVARVDPDSARALRDATPVVHADAAAHAREHSLEMQLPFLQHLLPRARIVPLLVGHQTQETADALASALSEVLRHRRALLVASTDLSHYQSRAVAATLDRVFIDRVAAFDADGLQQTLDRNPHHACGGGPTVAVLRAAELLGANKAAILEYADSGDVSGDTSAVVGYLAACLVTGAGTGAGTGTGRGTGPGARRT